PASALPDRGRRRAQRHRARTQDRSGPRIRLGPAAGRPTNRRRTVSRRAGHTGVSTAVPLDDAAATRAAFRQVFPGVMVAMFVASVDQTILATTLPAIGAGFADFANLSWVAI